MKSKKILLALAFGLFSMISCLALDVTVKNPYHNKGIKIKLPIKYEYKKMSRGSHKISDGSGVYIFPKNSNHISLEDTTSVSFQVKLTTEAGDPIIICPEQSYVAHKEDFITEKLFKETFSWDNKQGEISYKLRVHGRNSKIQSVKIAISQITIDGVDLGIKDGL